MPAVAQELYVVQRGAAAVPFAAVLPPFTLSLIQSHPACDMQLGLVVLGNLAGTAEGCLLLLRSPLLAKVEQQLHHLLQRRDGVRIAALLEPVVSLAAHAEGQKQILRAANAPGKIYVSCTRAP